MNLKDDLKENWKPYLTILIVIVLIWISLILSICDSANAESTRITFTSDWDMERQVNEIVAKCDTVTTTSWRKIVHYADYSDTTFRIIVTCREYVGVAVAVPIQFISRPIEHGGEKAHITVAGQAVVWWRVVKR